LDVRLTLLSAPPGYGKTTLVAQWIETRSRNGASDGLRASVSSGETLFAWYEVNDTDNTPQAFVEGLAASVARLDPALGAVLQEEIHSAAAVREDPQRAVTALLSALTPLAPASFVIILDDTEALTNPDSQEVLQYLLEHLPANGHLYLLTRVDPLLPLPRLRVRGQLLELRAAELRFTDEETTAFLKRAPGLNLSPAEVAELTTRAEGWAAPLWLAANAFGRFAASLNDVWEGLFAYLRDEVLTPQSPEVRDVLLRSAVLDRLNPDLCRAVLGVDNPAEWLARLEQRNLFLRRVAPQTSQTGASYAYHPLFLAFLRAELPRHLSDAETRSLHQRAAKECERQEDLEQALHHSLRTGDESGIARLLEQIAPSYLQQGRLEPLARWLDQLEPAVRDQHPRLTLNAGRIRQAEGRVEEARLLYLRASMDLEDRQDSTVQGDCLLALAELELLRGHYADGIELGQKAMDCWSEADVRRHMAALCAIGQLQAYQGDLSGAESTLKRAWRLTTDQAHPLLAFQALRTWAWTAYLQGTYHRAIGLNRLAEQEAGQEVPPDAVMAFRNPVPAILREWGEGGVAWEVTHRRLDGARKMKDHLALSHAYTDLGNLYLDRGRLTQAEEAFLQAVAEAEAAGGDGVHRLYGEVHLVYGYFLQQRATEAIEVAKSALHRCQARGASHLELALAQTAVCLAHLGLAKPAGSRGHALSVDDEFRQLLRIYRTFDQMGVRYGVFVSALLIGLACLIEAGTPGRLNQRRQARRYLTRALNLAAAEGYVQTIVTARQRLQPLMLFALREGIEPRFVSHVLARMGSEPLAALLEMTRAAEPATRARAATALKVIGMQGEIDDHRGHRESVLEALEQLASDADSEVRAAAAQARRHLRRLTD
jgi:ATP/maltotriose-dependent transcriptional regulator MalT